MMPSRLTVINSSSPKISSALASLNLVLFGFTHQKHKIKPADARPFHRNHVDVSKNRATPKWMVYNGKHY